ncbi:MAG: hypothetical protein KAU36_07780 [candidate division Zixibacteria bacterium]|nr:hypothetical protein [candidate division Zixibacteria bacterium]
MDLLKLILCAAMLVALFIGCDDDSNPVGPYPPILVTGEIISHHCYEPYDFTHPPVDATVEIIDSTGYTISVPVKDSGWFWTRVYPRRYSIVIETANTWPDTFFNVDIQADTSILFDIYDMYTYTDKLDFSFFYKAERLEEAREREIIDEINDLAGNILLPSEASREVIETSWGSVLVTYGVPVVDGCPIWYAFDTVWAIRNQGLLELPPDFTVDPGFSPCLM